MNTNHSITVTCNHIRNVCDVMLNVRQALDRSNAKDRDDENTKEDNKKKTNDEQLFAAMSEISQLWRETSEMAEVVSEAENV